VVPETGFTLYCTPAIRAEWPSYLDTGGAVLEERLGIAGSGAIAVSRTNPYLTPAMTALLGPGGPPLSLSKWFTDLLPTRENTFQTDTFRALIALDGDFDVGERNFYWSASGSHAETDEPTIEQTGDRIKFYISYWDWPNPAAEKWLQESRLLHHPRADHYRGNAMTKVDDVLIFCCVSAFFAGVVVAVTTLPV